jgi:hypothetical protein
MRTALDDATGVHHQDFMGIDHGGEAVRDHQRGLVLRHVLQFGLDGAFVGRVQRRGGFVKDQDRRVFEQGAGGAGSSTRVKQNQLKTILN